MTDAPIPTPDVRRLREPRERVSPKARVAWTLGALSTPVFFTAVLLVATRVFDIFTLRSWHVALIWALGLAYAVGMPLFRWRVHRFEVTDEAVYTQTGWFSVERRVAPINRVQTVDTHRGPFDQLLGLATVTVTTASAAGALQIAGLAVDRAQEIVGDITARAATERGDAT